jgi:hypothetical protein
MIKPLIFHTENIRAPTTMAAVPQTSKVHRGSCSPPQRQLASPPMTAGLLRLLQGEGGGGHFGAFADFSDSGGRGQCRQPVLWGPLVSEKPKGKKFAPFFFQSLKEGKNGTALGLKLG